MTGIVETVDLIPDGRDVAVTEANKIDYIQKLAEHKLVGSVREQITAFLTGFHELIPSDPLGTLLYY